MNGADLVMKTAAEAGVTVCFSNPGTTEMPLVAALDNIRQMRGVLSLFEGVCTGAADGYARMSGQPAMTLLHLGPGLGNGLANLHNARRAHSPMLNIIGDHATWHRPGDPLLNMDIEAVAGAVSGWQRTASALSDLSGDTADAITAARSGKIATLVMPHDLQGAEAGDLPVAASAVPPVVHDEASVEAAARILSAGKKSALILGGRALNKQGLLAAARIRKAFGCDLLAETFPARMDLGAGLPEIMKIPYLPEMALEILKPYEIFILAGARAPIAFFGYPGLPGRLTTDSQKIVPVSRTDADADKALERLAAAVNAPQLSNTDLPAGSNRPPMPSGKLDAQKACAVVAGLQPENAIVVEEAVTVGMGYYSQIAGCPPFTVLGITGGAIGQGPPCAVGAAIACPDRPVINFEADGSAMYTIQSLWTQSRENLNVTTLICNNRSYDILKLEMARAGNSEPGPNAARLTDLSGIDWVKMGEAMGVSSVAVSSVEGMADTLKAALAENGPHLIELQLF